MKNFTHYLFPEWPAPSWVKAATSLRGQGHSQAPYNEFNLGSHVGDQPEAIVANRLQLETELGFPLKPIWLNQVHGTRVINADQEKDDFNADAAFSQKFNTVCVILTADCLPVLITNKTGSCVAAAHAGWRGLAKGVIEATLDAIATSPEQTLIWLGPAIGPQNFEVGDEVRDQFLAQAPEYSLGFSKNARDRWQADLYLLAKLRLAKRGVTNIYGGNYCTYSQPDLFYSYRRDGGKTGRMATLIWLQK